MSKFTFCNGKRCSENDNVGTVLYMQYYAPPPHSHTHTQPHTQSPVLHVIGETVSQLIAIVLHYQLFAKMTLTAVGIFLVLCSAYKHTNDVQCSVMAFIYEPQHVISNNVAF